MGSSSFGVSVGAGDGKSVGDGVFVGAAVGVGVAGSGCSVGDGVVASFNEPAEVFPQAVQERTRITISNSAIIFVLFMIFCELKISS